MNEATDKSQTSLRLRRLVRIGLTVALSLAALLIGPDLFWFLGSEYILWVPPYLRGYCQFAAVVCLGYLFVRHPNRIFWIRVPERFWSISERSSSVVVDRVLPIILVLLTLWMFVLWLPLYLQWPWWADMDHFAVAAHSWDVGRLPYRDQVDYNFPGPIFLMWLLGKAFGWAGTVPPLALDAAMLAGLVAAMSAWSRVRFGRRLPGLAGAVLFAAYYMTLNAALVAQRDWQATWLVVMSLMVIETLPSRRFVWPLSAFLLAVAFAFRPYPVLFMPAFLAAIDARSRMPGKSVAISLKALLKFALIFAVMLVVVLSPLWLPGILDDFVRSLAYVVPGGAYNKSTSSDFKTRLVEELADWRVAWLLAPLAVLALKKTDRIGRSSRTWGLALVGAVLYRPIGPVGHHYLILPLQLLLSYGVVVILAAILAYQGWPKPSSRMLAVFVIACWFYQGAPQYCRLPMTWSVLSHDFLGGPPPEKPPGIDAVFPQRKVAKFVYNWESYNELLDHLRRTTTPKTFVANVFRKNCYPAVNGPLGRLSPFPGPPNMAWFRWVGTSLEPEYCRALAKTEDAVVVWTPGEKTDFPWMQLPRLVETIREHFRPEAKFGVMEVWRRIPKGTVPAPLPPYIPEELEAIKERSIPSGSNP